MQGTRRVSETTSAFESNALRHIVRRHRPLFPFPFQTPVFSCSLSPSPFLPLPLPSPLNSPYMIHEAHSFAIRWHDTHPTTVPWNHAPWSRDPPDHVIRLPLLPCLDYPLVATLLCDSPYNSTTSVRRQMQSFYLRSNTRRIIEPIEYGTIKYM